MEKNNDPRLKEQYGYTRSSMVLCEVGDERLAILRAALAAVEGVK